jgi:hypothetical protein
MTNKSGNNLSCLAAIVKDEGVSISYSTHRGLFCVYRYFGGVKVYHKDLGEAINAFYTKTFEGQ